jgi:hypothetical protein
MPSNPFETLHYPWMSRFGICIAAGALTALAALTSCSSSARRTPDAGPCGWPKGSVTSYALALGHTSGVRGAGAKPQHDRLLAFDVSTGRAVGDCAVEPDQLPQSAALRNQSQYPFGPSSYSTAGLPLPTTVRPRLVPDNAYHDATIHGGVRELADGTVTMLSFTGWRVVATSGTALVLTRDSGVSTPYRTAPADWCVLPSADAPRSSCAPIPAANTPGTGGIGVDGTIHWTPLAGPTTSVRGSVLTVARASDGSVTAAGSGPAGARNQLPTGLEQHSTAFLPGVSGLGSNADLRWLSGSDPASAGAVLHVAKANGDAVYALSEPPYAVTAIDRGAHLVTISRSGQAVEYTAGQAGRRLVQLRFPPGVIALDALSWPSTGNGSTA